MMSKHWAIVQIVFCLFLGAIICLLCGIFSNCSLTDRSSLWRWREGDSQGRAGRETSWCCCQTGAVCRFNGGERKGDWKREGKEPPRPSNRTTSKINFGKLLKWSLVACLYFVTPFKLLSCCCQFTTIGNGVFSLGKLIYAGSYRGISCQ